MSFKTRAAIFLYGAPNMAGCALALGGLGLYFSGVISEWWAPICAGLYLAGYMIIPASKGLEARVEREVQSGDLAASVASLLRQSRSRLPAEAIERLEAIKLAVEALAPKMFGGSMAMEQSIIMSNAITRDLPSTIENYLKLPAAFAAMHAMEGGKTCKAMLVDQLSLLDEQIAGIAESVYKNDANALRINGLLLQEKFRPVSFLD